MIAGRIRRSLVAKLLAAQLVVIVSGSVTLLLVALGVGPGIFRDHVRDALGLVPADVSRHLDEAFNEATLVALAIAVAAAATTAAAMSWVVSARVVGPIRALAAAAERIAGGAYSARVPVQGEDELALLAASFNQMAASLEAGERRRRELLADVAHELRTPLATLGAYVEGLADGVVEPGGEAWGALQAELGRLARLVDDLEVVSRAEERQLALSPSPIAPGELVARAAAAAAPAYAAKGVELETEVEERLPRVTVDEHRMGEVLGNLLDNALRHTPPGGRVTVAAGRSDGGVELTVTDTGEGIPAPHLERVFERFYRIDPARSRKTGGSGIGLTIARAIVEAHGGSIRAESEGPGRGARFIVTLPPLSASAWMGNPRQGGKDAVPPSPAPRSSD